MRSRLLFFVTILLIFGCTKEDLVNPGASNSAINLEIKFTDNQKNLSKINSPLKVNAVRVRVTGPDMTEITKNLSVSGNRATGTLEVPKGPNRKFEVEGLDDQNNVLIRGEGTKDLNNDTESITINAHWLQTSLNLSVPVPRPSNINSVKALLEGDGLGGETHTEILNIQGDVANKTFQMPRGEKNISILESVVARNLTFDLFTASHLANLVNSDVNLEIPADDIKPILEFENWYKWHDDSYEQYVPGLAGIDIDDIYAAGFDVTGHPVYFKSIRLEWIRWDGNPGNYRIVILDGFDLDANARFIFGPIDPAKVPHTDNRIQWNIYWAPPEAGRFDGTIIAGIQFLSNTGYPHIGYDINNPAGPSQSSFWYRASTNAWITASDGDFAITIVVQLPSGQQLELQPGRISNKNFTQKSRLAIGH